MEPKAIDVHFEFGFVISTQYQIGNHSRDCHNAISPDFDPCFCYRYHINCRLLFNNPFNCFYSFASHCSTNCVLNDFTAISTQVSDLMQCFIFAFRIRKYLKEHRLCHPTGHEFFRNFQYPIFIWSCHVLKAQIFCVVFYQQRRLVL